jgi:hypothetical protein
LKEERQLVGETSPTQPPPERVPAPNRRRLQNGRRDEETGKKQTNNYQKEEKILAGERNEVG